MILPSKHRPQNRALLTVGAVLLEHLTYPLTASALWEAISHSSTVHETQIHVRYDAFVLALDLLFLIGAIELHDGVLVRRVA